MHHTFLVFFFLFTWTKIIVQIFETTFATVAGLQFHAYIPWDVIILAVSESQLLHCVPWVLPPDHDRNRRHDLSVQTMWHNALWCVCKGFIQIGNNSYFWCAEPDTFFFYTSNLQLSYSAFQCGFFFWIDSKRNPLKKQ